MSEDCLTLNIFTTNISSLNRPVMLFIHGGGFHVGSKDFYRMRDLIEEEVILVTINYRLHVLGFLSFGNDLVSGNMGLRDQQLAIRWRYIQALLCFDHDVGISSKWCLELVS